MAPEEQIPLAYPSVRRVGLWTCYTLIAASLAILAGWQFRIPVLRAEVLGSFVAPNSALCFLLCGVSILLQNSRKKILSISGVALGLAVSTFGAVVLLEHLTGRDLGVDRIFFAHRLGDWSLPFPGRVAITSCTAFVIGGLGLALLRQRSRIAFADFAGCMVLGVAYIGIIGYMFGFRLFYGRVMAMPTALLFTTFGIAMLCSSSAAWVVRALSNPRLGGLLVRRLTAAIILLIPALAAIETWLEKKEIVNGDSGMAILVLVVVAVFFSLVLRTAAVMNSIDESRETAQQRATALSGELGALIEASPVGIIRFHKDLTVSSWSAAAERMLGWKAEEIIGKHIPGDQASNNEWAQFVSKLSAGASLVHIETKQLRRDGSVMDALVSGAPIHNAAGGEQEFMGVIADSTELKLAKEALIRTEKLSAAGRLAASIAHEINNPLEAITNLLYLARSTPEKVQQFLRMADEELARVTHLTKQTLGFYREAGAPEQIDIGALIEGVLNIYQSRLRTKQITVVRDNLIHEKINVVAGEIRQIISNLLANAIDASPSHGTITIRNRFVSYGHTRDSGVQVTIADTGSGIPATLKNKIWEPFFTTKKDTGTGLGLWVSKQIIEKYKGSIRFRSDKRGTAFVLFLPLSAPAQTLRASASSRAS
jgi:PAS domain S-box-containing protein